MNTDLLARKTKDNLVFNPKLKQLWIDALKSGKYRQGTDYLKRENKEDIGFTYCCLGVLCEVLIENDVPLKSKRRGQEIYSFSFQDGMALDNHLPDNLMQAIGLSKGDSEYLVKLNDDLHHSFDDIAEHLQETHLQRPVTIKRPITEIF